MLFLAALLSSAGALAPSDSAMITLRPHDASVPSLRWVALDDARRPVGRGITPGTIRQAADGVAVTYCSETGTTWLALVIEVGNGKGRMDASATCTRVVVRGTAVQTRGVQDPRLARASDAP